MQESDQRLQLLKNLQMAKHGCATARWAVKAAFQRQVHKLSGTLDPGDVESFESSCFKRIDGAIEQFRADIGCSFETFVRRKIYELANQHLKRRRSKARGTYTVSIEKLSERFKDEDGMGNAYEVEDDLAIVDDDILTNEKIALLAEDDPRKLAILREWTDGCYNDSETALLLAQKCGGKPESHRKFITRFRSHCQKALAYAN